MFAHTANSIIGIAHARCGQQPRVVCDRAAACWERSIVQRLCEMASLGKREFDVSEMEEGKTFACMAFQWWYCSRVHVVCRGVDLGDMLVHETLPTLT